MDGQKGLAVQEQDQQSSVGVSAARRKNIDGCLGRQAREQEEGAQVLQRPQIEGFKRRGRCSLAGLPQSR